MSAKPILFSGPMVDEIFTSGKNQTRRVIKRFSRMPELWRLEGNKMAFCGGFDYEPLPKCPYGEAGDFLWVREAWQAQNQSGRWWHEVPHAERDQHNWAWTNPVKPAFETMPPRWLPSIHMPRAACRIILQVNDVRVERLQDITLGDAIVEGCPDKYIRDEYYSLAPLDWFESLWNDLNYSRGYGWDSNPWVWVVKFHMADPDFWPFDIVGAIDKD